MERKKLRQTGRGALQTKRKMRYFLNVFNSEGYHSSSLTNRDTQIPVTDTIQTEMRNGEKFVLEAEN